MATEIVVRAQPNGYTLLLANPANAINASLYPNLNFNFIRDIAPVAFIGGSEFVMVVSVSVPAMNVAEFIAYAKANPAKINLASPGNGTSPHVLGELFKMMTGIEMLHVPYRGSAPALVDLMGGREQVMFDAMASSIGYIKAGKLRALAVTTATRSAALPDVPTVSDAAPSFEVSAWFGITAPAKTPPEFIDRLNKDSSLRSE